MLPHTTEKVCHRHRFLVSIAPPTVAMHDSFSSPNCQSQSSPLRSRCQVDFRARVCLFATMRFSFSLVFSSEHFEESSFSASSPAFTDHGRFGRASATLAFRIVKSSRLFVGRWFAQKLSCSIQAIFSTFDFAFAGGRYRSASTTLAFSIGKFLGSSA